MNSPLLFTRLRVCLFGLGLVLALANLGINLWHLQVDQRDVYAQKVQKQQQVEKRMPSARGQILDRGDDPWNNHQARTPITLAQNRVSYDIDIDIDTLYRNYIAHNKGLPTRLAQRRNAKGEVEYRREADVARIVYNSLQPIIQDMGGSITLPDADYIRSQYNKRLPVQIQTDCDFETIAKFSEKNLAIPGIDITARPVRVYPLGAYAAHILGYVGPPTDEKKNLADDGKPLETIGLQGIEQRLDMRLQGKPGTIIRRVNYRGYIVDEKVGLEPSIGDNIVLALDARIQFIVEQCMRGVGRGAAIIMDPNNGDVLAMVSVPNYDPNIFIPKVSSADWTKLVNDKTQPMLNRAMSPYPPGSIYKPAIALAALKSGAITPQTTIYSPGAIEIGGRMFKDWSANGIGNGNLREAIKMSCNTFFYQVGIKTGIKNLDAMGELIGFGHETGIDLSPENPGVLPGPEWMANSKFKREKWTTAHTANFSIGQGFVMVTPLQMCVMMSAIANGGTVYQPRLIKAVYGEDNEVKANFPVVTKNTLGVKQKDIDAIKEGLIAVVADGTGRRGGFPDVKVAGKTGTAQAWRITQAKQKVKDNRTWFLGFAPVEKPRYVFCVLVENGVAGGVTSAPIAHEILSRIFDLEKGKPVEIAALKPSVGHWNGVDLNADTGDRGESGTAGGPNAGAGDSDNDTGDHEPNIVKEDDDDRPAPKPVAPPPVRMLPSVPTNPGGSKSRSIPNRFFH